MSEYCFGIDVGGTTIKLGCFMTDGTLLENGKFLRGWRNRENIYSLMQQGK